MPSPRHPFRVLPPRSPNPDGNVERTNQTWRCEFHGCWELPDRLENINLLIDAFADEFNRIRPHRHLDCKTPEQAVRADANGATPEAGGTKKTSANNKMSIWNKHILHNKRHQARAFEPWRGKPNQTAAANKTRAVAAPNRALGNKPD